ncbi:transcriptional regulator, ArsR family [Archaeoglobus sulfaticallidus PM70-1]|uniref:Transcriptional regulator, ArsR family n=1 Tax=Archaeoglobus sulfaticallidus PM70-1 TaxID=387631 RepID=N0BGL6_9EURY|nr:metalloregulator ArsR/SmtB family transcription factor [Archaeoglobus sulfaticallidus]AGK61427.1 transcriptional regulator, ArsR family [Archaeoglobus sulfaticallidus PM70-1]
MDANTILEALGNDSRRRILSLLAKKPCYVSEISFALKMAPKAVIEHLEKLEKAGLIKSFEDGRRRYYYINQNMRVEVSIAPHMFQTSVISREAPDLDKAIKEARRLFDEINRSNFFRNISDIYRNLMNLREAQERFSMIQNYIFSKFSEMFERFLDEVERFVEDDYERIVLLGLSKGARSAVEIAEEFGLPYTEVEKAIERLKNKGIVREVMRDGKFEFAIKC